MTSDTGNYVFGPVPSRRLGRSLGVDLVPFKTCSFDCIYCQLGPTTNKTLDRREWVPMEDVLTELESKLKANPDYITLSGSGEPTLFSRVGELIDRIKAMTDVPVAVLTNGSLLWQPEVLRQLLRADLVVPSLDAGDEGTYRAINRPHPEISFERLVDGLIQFRREFRGDYWLEVMLLPENTAQEQQIANLVDCVKRIGPDRVQLNTPTRPPAEPDVRPLSPKRLAELASRFTPTAEVVSDFRGVHGEAEFVTSREEVLAMLRRRPCSLEDIAEGLNIHRNEASKYVQELQAEGRLRKTLRGQTTYYSAG